MGICFAGQRSLRDSKGLKVAALEAQTLSFMTTTVEFVVAFCPEPLDLSLAEDQAQ